MGSIRNLLFGKIQDFQRRLYVFGGSECRNEVEKLKNERAELLEEIEELKRIGESRASNLEEEIASLRDEVESLKEMLIDNK